MGGKKIISILILNHEAETKAFLKTFLINQGFDVRTAQEESTLKTAMEKIKADILIVDQPFYDDGELRVINEAGNIPMIFISSIPPESLVHYRKIQKLKNSDSFVFIEKPLQEDELLHSINILANAITSEKNNQKG